jgi:hypothetical protein
MERILHWICRLALVGAFALAGLAVGELVAQGLGLSLLQGAYAAGRLLEFGAILMVFAIGLQLREILAELRRGRG